MKQFCHSSCSDQAGETLRKKKFPQKVGKFSKRISEENSKSLPITSQVDILIK